MIQKMSSGVELSPNYLSLCSVLQLISKLLSDWAPPSPPLTIPHISCLGLPEESKIPLPQSTPETLSLYQPPCSQLCSVCTAQQQHTD